MSKRQAVREHKTPISNRSYTGGGRSYHHGDGEQRAFFRSRIHFSALGWTNRMSYRTRHIAVGRRHRRQLREAHGWKPIWQFVSPPPAAHPSPSPVRSAAPRSPYPSPPVELVSNVLDVLKGRANYNTIGPHSSRDQSVHGTINALDLAAPRTRDLPVA